MSKYNDGRSQAAFEIMRRIENDDASLDDIMQTVNNTLNNELEKTASEDDMDVKRGIDAFCFDFLKVATEISGTYDLSDMSDEDFLAEVLITLADEETSDFDKIASDYEEEEEEIPARSSMQSVSEKAQAMRKAASYDKALDIVNILEQEGLL